MRKVASSLACQSLARWFTSRFVVGPSSLASLELKAAPKFDAGADDTSGREVVVAADAAGTSGREHDPPVAKRPRVQL